MLKRFIIALIISVVMFVAFVWIITDIAFRLGLYTASPDKPNLIISIFFAYLVIIIVAIVRYIKDKDKISLLTAVVSPPIMIIGLYVLFIAIIYFSGSPPVM